MPECKGHSMTKRDWVPGQKTPVGSLPLHLRTFHLLVACIPILLIVHMQAINGYPAYTIIYIRVRVRARIIIKENIKIK